MAKKVKITLVDAVPTGTPNESDYTVLIDYADPALRDETQVYRWTCVDKPALKAKLDELADHYEAQVQKRGRTPDLDPNAAPLPGGPQRGAPARAFEAELIDQTITAK